MGDQTKIRLSELDQFDLANSKQGRLRRHVQGRVRALPSRMAFALAGSVLLAFAVSPMLGVLTALVTFPLELAENFVLRRVQKENAFHNPKTGKIVEYACVVQVLGLAFCISVAGFQTDGVRLLAWAFLIGAAINSMLSAGYHPASYRIRKRALFLTSLIVLGGAFAQEEWSGEEIAVECAAVGVAIMTLTHLHKYLIRRDQRMIKAERELLVRAQMSQRLALVAKHATDSIFIMDEDTRIVWVNRQFTSVMGYTPEEVIGRKPNDFMNHPNTSIRALKKLAKAAKARQPVSVRVLNRTKDGAQIWIETHQTPVMNEDGSVEAIIAVERDVTQVVAHEKQLKAALIGAKEADREKAAFLSRMSHELRTPANGIIGGLELLNVEGVCKDQQDVLQILNDASVRLMELLENIVTVADASSGMVAVCDKAMFIEEVIGGVVESYKEAAREKELDLSVQVHCSAQKTVQSDPVFWRNILRKLVSNAIKFTPEGSVKVTAEVINDSHLVVSVADTGVGVSKDKMQTIFEKFAQADNGISRDHDGAGLGLTLVQELVNLMKGSVTVQSEIGEGSRFEIKVPVRCLGGAADEKGLTGEESVVTEGAQQAAEDGAVTAVETGQISAERKPLRLLIAEDNRTNRLLIKSMLKNGGYDVHFAEDGVRAIEEYKRTPPELIFMDVSMPNKNGLEATREIREIEKLLALPHCKIVAVTANVSQNDQRLCREAGMDDFIAKPLRKERLIQSIEEVVR